MKEVLTPLRKEVVSNTPISFNSFRKILLKIYYANSKLARNKVNALSREFHSTSFPIRISSVNVTKSAVFVQCFQQRVELLALHKKLSFPLRIFFSKCYQIRRKLQFPVDLVTYIEEIFNGKSHFFVLYLIFQTLHKK